MQVLQILKVSKIDNFGEVKNLNLNFKSNILQIHIGRTLHCISELTLT